MMATSRLFECSVCKALFRTKPDLTTHLNKISPKCKTTPKKRDPHTSTETHAVRFNSTPRVVTNTKTSVAETKLADAALVAAMEAGMELKKPKQKKSGVETAILSTIADGDEEMVSVYSKITLDPVTGTRPINEDLINYVTSKAKINMNRIAELASRAQNVSICFLLDTTGSMSSYISGVKEQIVDIVELVEASGCGIEGLAFVGYKDWCDGTIGREHFELLPFTKSVAEFKAFVALITAKGGGDFPEDVRGGLYKAISLSWPERSGTRIIFHLGDAPPHGKKRFHPNSRHKDDYPNGHPKDRSLKELFEMMLRNGLVYYFGRINGECDHMISVFEKYYGQKIQTMDSTEVASICSSVIESVVKSVSVTYHAAARAPVAGKTLKTVVIDIKEPNWGQLPRLDGTILTYELPESIADITSFTKLGDKIKQCRLQIAPNPFSKGSVRNAYYGKIFYSVKEDTPSASRSTEVADNIVFKEMISPPKLEEFDRQRYMTDLEVQTIAAKLALDFNGKLSRTTYNPNMKIKFLMTKVVRILNGDSQRYLAYEKRFHGSSPTLIKYTNNMDFVLDSKTLDEEGRRRLELALAFSHFTHDITDGYLLVCDLQGIFHVDTKGKETLLLTDPAIHCSKHLRFGKTNLSSMGINKFFAKHVCNKFCEALGLKMPNSKPLKSMPCTKQVQIFL